MQVNNKIIDFSPTHENIVYEDTYVYVALNNPIIPGSGNTISLNWEYTVNMNSHIRSGQVDSTSFFIAYFFPRIGVYDDIEGWNDYYYTGVGEFYNDFGDFDVNITVPGGFVVWATGELQNAKYTLSDKYYKRFEEARNSDKVITIIDPTDLIYQDFTAPDPEITWRYKAQNVSDFAFALSDHYLWDAIHLEVDKPNGKKVFLQTAYDKNSPDFFKVIQIAKKSILYMSEELPGVAFPYPAMTVFNGLDEMEYPMIVNDHSLTDIKQTFSLTAHEIYHTYFPFLTGCNERKYAWMDEGLTSFFEFNLLRDVIDSNLTSLYFLDYYHQIQGSEKDIPIYSSSEIIRPDEYYAISYPKVATFYSVLRDEVGFDNFKAIIQKFISDWKGKHPTGHDLLYAFNFNTEQDLTWLIRPWIFEFGYVDLGIKEINQTGNNYSFTIENKGLFPAPVLLKLNFKDQSFLILHEKPGIWKNDIKEIKIETEFNKQLQSAELIYSIPMDVNTDNDHYQID